MAATTKDLERIREARRTMRASNTWHEFVRELTQAGLSRDFAEQAASSVLCALEHRILAGEAKDLEAQLPRHLRELLHKCERHEGERPRRFGKDEFIRWVSEDLGEQNAEDAMRAVFRVISRRVSAGEVEQVVRQLPRELRAYWPEEVQRDVVRQEGEEAKRRHRYRALEPSHRPGGHSPIDGISEALYELPVQAQLGILRAVAPRVLASMAPKERDGFLHALVEESEHLAHSMRTEPRHTEQ